MALENGKIKYALSEERINRKKNWWGNPYKTINFLLKENNLKIKDIDIFATHGLSTINKDVPNREYFKKKIDKIKNSNLKKKNNINKIRMLKERFEHEIKVMKRGLRNINSLKKKIWRIRNS